MTTWLQAVQIMRSTLEQGKLDIYASIPNKADMLSGRIFFFFPTRVRTLVSKAYEFSHVALQPCYA